MLELQLMLSAIQSERKTILKKIGRFLMSIMLTLHYPLNLAIL
jgi:hypothetical protein